jgi:hypothetical protein
MMSDAIECNANESILRTFAPTRRSAYYLLVQNAPITLGIFALLLAVIIKIAFIGLIHSTALLTGGSYAAIVFAVIFFFIMLLRLRRQKLTILSTTYYLTSHRLIIHQTYPRLNQRDIDYHKASGWRYFQSPLQMLFSLGSLIPNFDQHPNKPSNSSVINTLNSLSNMSIYDSESIDYLSREEAQTLEHAIKNADTLKAQSPTEQQPEKESHTAQAAQGTPSATITEKNISREKRYAIIFPLRYLIVYIVALFALISGLLDYSGTQYFHNGAQAMHFLLGSFIVYFILSACYALKSISRGIVRISKNGLTFSNISKLLIRNNVVYSEVIQSSMSQSIMQRLLGLYTLRLVVRLDHSANPNAHIQVKTIPFSISGLSHASAKAILAAINSTP